MIERNDIPARPADLLFGGRREAIAGQRCIQPPIGCGQAATTFRDAPSAKEFTISGLCQECQDTIFGA